MTDASAQLPEKLLTILRAGVPAILLTVDEEGLPHSAFSFAAASRPDRAAVVVDEGSRTLANIERTGRGSVQVLAPGNEIYLLKGTVHLSPGRMVSSPVACRRAELTLTVVRHQAWPEIAVTPLTYHYSARARSRWESAVPRIYAELRGESIPPKEEE